MTPDKTPGRLINFLYKKSEADLAKKVMIIEICRAMHMKEDAVYDILQNFRKKGLVSMDSGGGVKITVDGIREALNFEEADAGPGRAKEWLKIAVTLMIGFGLGFSTWFIQHAVEKREVIRQNLHIRQVMVNDMIQEAYFNYKVVTDHEIVKVNFYSAKAKMFGQAYLKYFSFGSEKTRGIVTAYLDAVDPENPDYLKGVNKKKSGREALQGIAFRISNAIKIMEEAKENNYDFTFNYDESILTRDMQGLAEWK